MQNYHKILIAIAAVALLAGVGYAFYSSQKIVPASQEKQENQEREVVSDSQEILTMDDINFPDISKWATFRNEKYGYEIKYPSEEEGNFYSKNYFLDSKQSDDVGWGRNLGTRDKYYRYGIRILVSENSEKLSVSDWLKKEKNLENFEKITILGNSGFEAFLEKGVNGYESFKNFHISQGNFIYSIKLLVNTGRRKTQDIDPQLEEMILGTFKINFVPEIDTQISHSESGVSWYEYPKKIKEAISFDSTAGSSSPDRSFLSLYRVGKFKTGKYAGKDLILATALPDYWGKGSRSSKPSVSRLVLEDGKAILLSKITNINHYLFNSDAEFFKEGFSQLNLEYTEDVSFTVPVLEYTETITGNNERQILKYDTEEFGKFENDKLVKVFADKQYGNIYTTGISFAPDKSFYYSPFEIDETEPAGTGPCRGEECFTTNSFFVFRPDGTFLRYFYKPDFSKNNNPYYYQPNFSTEDVIFTEKNTKNYDYFYSTRIGCSDDFVDYMSVVSPDMVNDGDLTVVGNVKTTGDTIYGLRGRNHQLLREFYDNYKNKFSEWSGHAGTQYEEDHPDIVSYEEFIDTYPVFFWRDPFGRLVRFNNKEFLPPIACEPIIYLYPENEQQINISLELSGAILDSHPVYNEGWSVIAKPSGELTNLHDGRSYPHLFWEGWSSIFPIQEKGFVVERSEVPAFFNDILPRLGLNPKETNDFAEAWLPAFSDAPYYFITFLDKEFIDHIAPLNISPKPDTVIRVLMDFKPLEEKINVSELKIPRAPQRAGFTVVEWGGLKR